MPYKALPGAPNDSHALTTVLPELDRTIGWFDYHLWEVTIGDEQ